MKFCGMTESSSPTRTDAGFMRQPPSGAGACGAPGETPALAGAGGQFDPEVVAALVGIVEARDAPSRDEAGGQPDTDPSSEHKLEPAIG
jgi:hypothetical protein